MAIINGTVNTYAVTETLATQAQANGIDEIVLSDTLLNLTPDTTDIETARNTYARRILILRRDQSNEETRYCTSVAAGTGTTQILTVTEPWVTAPSSGETVDVFYTIGDMNEDGSYLNTRTGFYEVNDTITIQSGGGVAFYDGVNVEVVDSKSTTNYGFIVQSGGRFQVGYIRAGVGISGSIMTGVNNAQGETWMNFQSGSKSRTYDIRMLAPLNPLQWNAASGSDFLSEDFTVFGGTDEGLFFNVNLKNGSISGSSTSTEIIRINSGSVLDGVRLINTAGITTASGDTSTETLTMRNCLWASNIDFIIINSNKTWEIINPTWIVTAAADFNWTTTTSNKVNERYSVELVLQNPSLTKLQNGLGIVYRGSGDAINSVAAPNLDIVDASDVNGVIDNSFVYREYTGGTTTNTAGTHILRVDTWLYDPFLLSLSSTEKYVATITLTLDPYIVQTTQATAITAGSSVTWTEDTTNPFTVLEIGTVSGGTLAVSDSITQTTSGATGTVIAILDGDGTGASTNILIDVTSGTFDTTNSIGNGTWTATPTGTIAKFYDIAIDANGISLQALYDYLAAVSSDQTTVQTSSSTGEKIHLWGKNNQARALYYNGSVFRTERSGTQGIIVYDNSGGNVQYYTDNAGNTYTPPVSYNFVLTGLKDGTEIRLIRVSDSTNVAGVEDMTGGSGTSPTSGVAISGSTDNNTFTYSYVYASDIAVYAVIMNLDYQYLRQTFTLSNATQTIPISQVIDRNFSDP
jgi:hypothetical protein